MPKFSAVTMTENGILTEPQGHRACMRDFLTDR